MNIQQLVIKNVKSFGKEVSIDFNDDLNIFIGPNAGGKSNLMDILNITISRFFIYPWRLFQEFDGDTGFTTSQYFQNRRDQIFHPANKYLDKHNNHLDEDQEIRIKIKSEQEDINNIKILKENSEKMISFEYENYKSQYVKLFIGLINEYDVQALEDKSLEYLIKNLDIDSSYNNDIDKKVFLAYLNNFDLFSLIINEYNSKVEVDNNIQRLFPPIIYFSPYRIPSIRNLVVNISNTNYLDLLEKYKKSDSKNISSTFEVATYYFASKFLHAKDDNTAFEQDEEVKVVKEYLRKLGYNDFTFRLANQPQSREKNIYEAILTRSDGEKVEISKSSSGEKEIFNLLLGVFAFNIKNGVIIIDEPDLHLHPKWQYLLLDLFFMLSAKRGIQFFIVTHSPHFITNKSVKNVLRVYKEKAESDIISPLPFGESEKDIFQIINVFNNTKIYFADKVVLVEGDVDLIIYDSVLRRLQEEEDFTKVIEILSVTGSGNLDKFQVFLEKWKIPSYRVADAGYSSTNSSNLFILSKRDIGDYFQDANGVRKGKKYEIDDAIKKAKQIEHKEIEIPSELKDVFEKIIE